MTFLGIGVAEWLVIIIIALIVLGPEKFPIMARRAGELIREFRSIVHSFTQEVGQDIDLSELYELRRELEETRQEMRRLAYQTPRQVRKDINEAVDKTNKAVLKSGDSKQPKRLEAKTSTDARAEETVAAAAESAESPSDQPAGEAVTEPVSSAGKAKSDQVEQGLEESKRSTGEVKSESAGSQDGAVVDGKAEPVNEPAHTDQESHGNKNI